MSANLPTRIRQFTLKGKTEKRVSLNREGNKITEIDMERATRTEHEFKTCADARRAMNNPASFVS